VVQKLLTKVFGTKHERDIKRMMPTVQAISASTSATSSE
jgi:hypothetical protein